MINRLPFTVEKSIELDDSLHWLRFLPAQDLRTDVVQEFYAVLQRNTTSLLMKVACFKGKWIPVKEKRTNSGTKEEVISCHVLPNSYLLIVYRSQFDFYSLDLTHLETQKTHKILCKIGDIRELTSLDHTDKCEFIMRARVEDIDSIKPLEVKHTFKGTDRQSFLIAVMGVNMEDFPPQLSFEEVNLRSIFLE